MKQIELSVVIPVYNSSGIIAELNEQINNCLKNFTYELIFINDSSIDNSWIVLTEIIKKNSFVTGINLRKNCGQDNAIMAGLRQASGNYVVIMDDDLQHSPSDILELYSKCKEGYDVCYARFKNKNQSIIKNLGSQMNGFLARKLISKPKNIYLSPFKVLRREIVDEIIKFESPFTYIDGIILNITSSLAQIDVEHFPRKSGNSNYNLKKSASVFFRLFTGFSVVPLRLATYLGIIITLFGLGMIVKYLYDYFITKNFIEGWTTLVILQIFFGGLILMTLGLIGEYLGRTFLSINKKPQYSIKQIIGNCDSE